MIAQMHPPAHPRRADRCAVRLWCEVISSRSDQPSGYLAADLSPEGVWLQTSDPVRAGEHVVACFEPNDGWRGREIVVFAEVVRVTTSRRRLCEPGVGMALEFIDLTRDERRLLGEWLLGRSAPTPRYRPPTGRFRVPRPDRAVSHDEGPQPDASAALDRAATSPTRPISHRPLHACWR